MKVEICEVYDHLGGKEILFKRDGIWTEIKNIFNNKNLIFEKGEPRYIKITINDTMQSLGWADNVVINPSNLTINYLKNNVGICFQLGNVARLYADLLKLKILFDRKVIDLGVIIVPVNEASKKLGSNYANYERLIKELQIFSGVIEMPISVIGLY